MCERLASRTGLPKGGPDTLARPDLFSRAHRYGWRGRTPHATDGDAADFEKQ
jgi:hypothetical protein